LSYLNKLEVLPMRTVTISFYEDCYGNHRGKPGYR